MFNKNNFEDFTNYYNFKKSNLEEYGDFYHYFNNKIKNNINNYSIESILKKLKIKNLNILNKIINNIKKDYYLNNKLYINNKIFLLFKNKFLKHNKLNYNNTEFNYNIDKNLHTDKLLENDVLYLKFKDSEFFSYNDLLDMDNNQFMGYLDMAENILKDNSTRY
jgi:hypothetical protein